MDSTDGTNGVDNMETIRYDQPEPGTGASAAGAPDPAGTSRPRWSGRTKRVVTSVAASALLLGSGAAIGVAVTGGAAAATGNTSPGTANAAAAATAASSVAGRCAKLAQRLKSKGHPVAANRLGAFCRNPLVRLVLVGGAHGEVTFETKAGPKTIAVERGTVQAVSSSGITVQAKDGTTWTWDFTTSTVVRDAKQTVGRDKLSTGETVLIAGQVVSGVHDARLIRIRNAG